LCSVTCSFLIMVLCSIVQRHLLLPDTGIVLYCAASPAPSWHWYCALLCSVTCSFLTLVLCSIVQHHLLLPDTNTVLCYIVQRHLLLPDTGIVLYCAASPSPSWHLYVLCSIVQRHLFLPDTGIVLYCAASPAPSYHVYFAFSWFATCSSLTPVLYFNVQCHRLLPDISTIFHLIV
jgi:hypothetical protein